MLNLRCIKESSCNTRSINIYCVNTRVANAPRVLCSTKILQTTFTTCLLSTYDRYRETFKYNIIAGIKNG